ncbi:MAG: cysteine desulfurase NifS [Clostridia bacterium]|nr:cysteine desulfurase NifS [Clostridia bacterium]
MIYADNAATTKPSKAVIEAMLPYFEEVYGNPSSLHTPGQKAAEALQLAREKIAACLGASPKEITFTSGGSEADNQALRSAAYLGKRNGKTHILSTAFEHHAVLHTLKALEKEGFTVELLPVSPEGLVTAEQVETAIREDTCLVSVMFAQNEIGTIQPIGEIGEVCHRHGVLFHTDAVQAAGHIAIDVRDLNVDLLSLSAHKFHGPKGVGALYARSGIRLSSIIEGGAQERGKRAGTENLPAIVGMAKALEDATAHLEENAQKVTALRERLIEGLSKIPHSALNGDRYARVPGTVNFCFEGIEGESLLLLLDMAGIAASSGSACTSGSLDPSHVLLAIGRPHEVAHGSLRLSLSEENTDEDVDTILKEVPRVVEYLRSMSPVWKDLVAGKRKFIL